MSMAKKDTCYFVQSGLESCFLADHYADDLEVDLEEIMTESFNVELEDESPRLVSKELVNFHNDLIQGNTHRFTLLQQTAAQGASASQKQTACIPRPISLLHRITPSEKFKYSFLAS